MLQCAQNFGGLKSAIPNPYDAGTTLGPARVDSICR